MLVGDYMVFIRLYIKKSGTWGGVVVNALRYYSDGPEIDSRWCHWFFQWHYFRPYRGPGVNSAPSENEYQEHFLGVKAAGAWGWQPHQLHVSNVVKSGNLNLLEPSGPHRACYLYYYCYHYCCCYYHYRYYCYINSLATSIAPITRGLLTHWLNMLDRLMAMLNSILCVCVCVSVFVCVFVFVCV
jgi:hypothetical protein